MLFLKHIHLERAYSEAIPVLLSQSSGRWIIWVVQVLGANATNSQAAMMKPTLLDTT